MITLTTICGASALGLSFLRLHGWAAICAAVALGLLVVRFAP